RAARAKNDEIVVPGRGDPEEESAVETEPSRLVDLHLDRPVPAVLERDLHVSTVAAGAHRALTTCHCAFGDGGRIQGPGPVRDPARRRTGSTARAGPAHLPRRAAGRARACRLRRPARRGAL